MICNKRYDLNFIEDLYCIDHDIDYYLLSEYKMK